MIVSPLILSGSGLNEIYEACCGTIELEVSLLPGEGFREIHRIEWLDGCGGQIISVNGIPYQDPLPYHFTITDDPDTNLKFIVQICECQGAGNTWSARLVFHIQNPNSTQDFDFDFFPIKLNCSLFPITQTGEPLRWFPCSNDCTEIQPQGLEIINQSCLDMDLNLSTDCDSALGGGSLIWYLNGVAQSGGFFPVPPGSSMINWTVCSTPILGSGSCGITASMCSNTCDIPIIWETVQCEGCGLNCTNVLLATENYYAGFVQGLCQYDSTLIYDRMAMAGMNWLAINHQYNYGFFGNDIDVYFNPWLYDVVCNIGSKYGQGIVNDPPPAGWHIKFQPSMMDAGFYQMTLYGAGINANSQKNFDVFISFFDDFEYLILFRFFNQMDLDNWVDTGVVPNQPKFLLNHALAPTPLQNIVQSVYNVNKSICTLSYIVDPNQPQLIPNTDPPQYEVFECGMAKTFPVTARFYNQGLYGAPSEFSNPTFILERNSVQVPNFSTLLKTRIRFRIQNLLVGNISDVVLLVFDETQFDNFNTIDGNYDLSRAEMVTSGAISVLDNHLQSPSSAPFIFAPNVWEVNCFMDTNLNPSGSYRIVAVVYNAFSEIVNSFISDPILVTQIPGIEICCPLDIDSQWENYFNDEAGSPFCYSPTMMERIRNRMIIQPGGFGTCLQNFGWNPILIPWIELLKSIKLNVYHVETGFPTATQNTYFMFDQYLSIRTPGFPGNWNNTTPGLIVSETGLILNTNWEGRVRYEDQLNVSGSNVFLANQSTPMTRTPAGGLGSIFANSLPVTYDWGDRDIFFEFIFEFDLGVLFPDPCTVNLVATHKVHPTDFEINPNPYASWLKPLLIKGYKDSNPPVTINSPFCEGQYDYLLVDVASNNTLPAMKGYLIAFLDPYPYSVNSLLEDDGSNPSPNGFIQLDATQIYDVDPYFNNSGTFKVDVSNLPAGKYKICGLFIDDPNDPNP